MVGIRPMEGGVFSNWAINELKAGCTLAVMPPDGRFVSRRMRALHRVGFAADSGVTPILSTVASTLEDQPESKFTLIYGNRSMASVIFNESLQDLKDRYPNRLTLIHILSRQAQEADLLQGRIDGDKIRAIIDALRPVSSMDEVFICGPEVMIEVTEAALLAAGVPADRVHCERFTSPTLEQLTPAARQAAVASHKLPVPGKIALTVMLDGKPHELHMNSDQHVLDVALAAGLDVETFVTNVVKDEVADDIAMQPRRRMSHEEFRARLQRIIDLHPVSHHFVDDSRESIYAGRGE